MNTRYFSTKKVATIGGSILVAIVMTLALVDGSATFVGKVFPQALQHADASTNCNQDRDLEGYIGIYDGGARVKNVSTNCTYQVGLATYKVFTLNTENNQHILTQELYDYEIKTSAPGSEVTLHVDRPSCAYQIDLFQGALITHFTPDNFDYDLRVIDGLGDIVSNGRPLCNHVLPQISVACTVTPSQADIGQSVTWAAQVQNAQGAVSYSWTGTDGVSSTASIFSRSYNSSGTKNATVSVTANGQTKSAQCSMNVRQPVPTLGLTCSANPSNPYINDSVTWTAHPTGGSGNYTYSWSGTNGLSGNTQTVHKSYSSTGTKNGTVTVTSNGQSRTVDCSTVVREVAVPTLDGSCAANPSNPYLNDTVTWTATASGGTGSYTYSWSGTDNLSGSSQTLNKSYSSTGTKTGTVTITSGNQSVTRNCTTQVREHISNINASCSVSNSNPGLNQSVTWTATASGGNGNFSYSWNGTDNLTSNTSQVTKSYSSSGSKTGTVVVTSGGQTVTVQCSLYVQQEQNNDFNVSCIANPSNAYINNQVTWSANVNGGNGNYTYSWSGDEGLSGNNQTVYKTYNNTGTKYGTVTVYSNGQSRTAQCNTNVQNQTTYNNLNVSCYANPTNPRVNEQVTWTANANGGNGNFSYSWTGTDNLYGSTQTLYKAYSSEGQKQATVTVYSNGQSQTQTCYVTVQPQITYTPPPTYYPPTYTPPPSYVYLNQVPYTGIGSAPKVVLFALTLIAWSAFVAYMVIRRKAIANGITVREQLSGSVGENIKAFKAKMAKENRYDFLRK
jgi:hypothetical protein